jgi:hypothetical protein
VVGFAVATTLLPPLRCLGAGYLYMYNAMFPAALLLALLSIRPAGAPVWASWAAALAIGTWGIALFLARLRRQRPVDEGSWRAVVEFLREAPAGPVLCLPYTLADPIAYETDHPVLWGGHGYGFRRLEPFFPRLLRRIPEIAAAHGLRYILIGEAGLPAALEGDLAAFGERRDFGPYRLFIGPAGREVSRL